MTAIKQQILFYGPASDCRRKSLLMNFIMLLFVLSSYGCRPDEIEPTVTATIYDPPPPGIHEVTQAPTLTRTPTIPTLMATATPTNPPASTPEYRSTPTPGLPPTLTSGPAEVCPAPTHAEVKFSFTENPLEYESLILNYLRANGDLAGAMTQITSLGRMSSEKFDANEAFVIVADVTGDSIDEFILMIIQMRAPEKDQNPHSPRHEMVLFIFGCRALDYALHYSAITESDYLAYSDGSQDSSKTPIMVTDANADGIREVFYQYGFFYSPDYFLHFDVLEWNSGSFHSLITEHGAIINPVNDPIFEDIDGNGTLEILLTEDRSRWSNECDAGSVRDSTDILMWDGEYYQYMWTDPGIPRYRFQAAFDGDYYVTVGLFDRAEFLYLLALNDPELEPFIWREWAEKFGIFCSVDWFISEPNEPLYIRAYTRLRLLELYVYLEKMEEAKAVWIYFNGHKATITEFSYASLAQAFWETYETGNSIDAACQLVNEKAVEIKEELFSWMVYGYQNPGPAAETICPFQ
jgi:hypothetical protein